MAILHFRIDDRLIHGQVAVAWTKIISTNHIILANDKVAKDPVQQSLLKLSAPRNVRVSMVPIEKAVGYLLRGTPDEERIFLLVKTIPDALKIVSQGVKVKEINMGNMGYKEGAVALTKRLYASEEELQALKDLIDLGIRVYAKLMPNDSEIDLKEVINKKFK